MNTPFVKLWNWFRQPISGLSHFLGVIIGIAGLLWLVSIPGFDWPKLISAAVFLITLTILFLASTLYHLLPLSERGIQRLRKLDHSAIYLFIAGCYTPVCIMLFRGTKGLLVLGSAWILALAGIALKLLWMETSRWLRVGLYVGLVCVSIVIMPDMIRMLPGAGVAWLFTTLGLFGLGALVYILKWPDPAPDVFGFHEVWHLFVLAGVLSYFWFVKQYVLLA